MNFTFSKTFDCSNAPGAKNEEQHHVQLLLEELVNASSFIILCKGG